MRLRHILPASLLLASCAPATVPGLPGPSDTDTATIALTSRLQASDRVTQELIQPWKATDVDHLRVSLFIEDATPSGAPAAPLRAVQVDGVAVVADIAQGDLDDPVRFMGLRRNAIYVAQARAYRAPESTPANLISIDERSQLRVPVGQDDRLVVGTLSVQFADRVFAGTASPTLAFIGAGLVAAGPLTLTYATPSPVVFRIRPPAARR